jgi:hypothetical protein
MMCHRYCSFNSGTGLSYIVTEAEKLFDILNKIEIIIIIFKYYLQNILAFRRSFTIECKTVAKMHKSYTPYAVNNVTHSSSKN